MRSDTAGSWKPVALSADLPAGTVIPARLPNATIALWRSASGRVAASADRCPHRGMRLSHGFVRGEVLSCIYHGWSYARAGHCLRIPAHPGLTPPETIRVATYPVEEAGGVLWIAVDEPAAEPPRIEGVAPLRSLTAVASSAAIEAAAGAKASPEGLLNLSGHGHDICLLLSPNDDGETLIHVLVPEQAGSAERIAASRTAEGVRRRAEELQQKEVAR